MHILFYCQSNNKNRHSQTLSKYTQNLRVTVKAFVHKFFEVSDTMFTLYDGDTMKAITENFCVKWGCNGMPLNVDQVLFTDLSSADLSSRKIYVICQVVRWGGMHPKVEDTRLSTASLVRKQSANSLSLAAGRSAQAASTSDGSSAGVGTNAFRDRGQLRRPFGVAFYDLTAVLRNPDGVQFPLELDMPFLPCEKENFDSTLRKLIGTSDKSRIESKLAISVCLENGETKQVRGLFFLRSIKAYIYIGFGSMHIYCIFVRETN